MDQTSLPSQRAQRPALHLGPNDSVQVSPSFWTPLPYNPSPPPGVTAIWARRPLQPLAGPLPVDFSQGQHTFPRLRTDADSVQTTLPNANSSLPSPGQNLLPHARSRQAMPQWGSLLHEPMPDVLSENSLNNSNVSGMLTSSSGSSSTATSAAMLSSGGPRRGNIRTSENTYQPPTISNWASPNATFDTHASSASPLSFSGRLANASGQQQQQRLPDSSFNSDASRQLSQTLSHYSEPRSSAASTSVQRPRPNAFAFPSIDRSAPFSLAPERRRQTSSRGTRRSSMSSRQPISDPLLSREVSTQQSFRYGASLRHQWDVNREARLMRQLQTVRGGMECKMVASKAALQSLESVPIDTLEENDKTCVICYNDYGTESPEGRNEAPLRLPQCQHMFGDYCIKKWLEDSDSCPYCRCKLQAEPKFNSSGATAARTFLSMMRAQGWPLPAEIGEDLITRVGNGSIGDLNQLAAILSPTRTAERRSLPDEAAGQNQRRTRQRRSSPGSHERFMTVSEGSSLPSDGMMHNLLSQSPPQSRVVDLLSEDSYSISIAQMGNPQRSATRQGTAGASTHPGLEDPLPSTGGHTARNPFRVNAAYMPPDRRTAVIARGSSRDPSIPNPLQRPMGEEPRAFGSTVSTSQPPNPPSTDAIVAQSYEADLAAPRPSRNRPW